jgi:hypothetical protein
MLSSSAVEQVETCHSYSAGTGTPNCVEAGIYKNRLLKIKK